MYLGQVLLLFCMGAALLVMPSAAFARKYWPRSAHDDRLGLVVCVYFLGALVASMWLRSLDFGVDTAAYAEFFKKYCGNFSLEGEEFSFIAAAALLNIGMLGVCQVDFLPGVWVIVLIGAILLLQNHLLFRLRFSVLLLFSMVGVELSTNALRQGFSVVFMVVGLSFGRNAPIRALALLGVSIAFHSSAALILFCIALVVLPWRILFVVLASLCIAVYAYVDSGVDALVVGAFLYEVQKYLSHDSDEIWIRLLSFACVLSCLAAFIFRVWGAGFLWVNLFELLKFGKFAKAAKLGLICIPFLFLPYFGYRFVYGVYPVILYYVMEAASDAKINVWKMFYVIFCMNMLAVFVWLQGSSYMRDVLFFE